jgi:cyclopropane fatty-acyl-phospholipid synthase-like methyltransferase
MNPTIPEDFEAVRRLYDEDMADNVRIHDLVYPEVFGGGEYIGQFSDNSASELLAMGRAMGLPPGSRVLDVGCGRGRVALFLARTFGWKLTGIDLAGVPMAYARVMDGVAGTLELVEGNLYTHLFPGPFDGIYGTGAFCHFEAGRLFRRLRDLLRPGGVLAFMERVRLRTMSREIWERLTRSWHCPSVYTVDEYRSLFTNLGFGAVEVRDLTPGFRRWQERSVEVRRRLRAQIIALSSPAYHETALRLASFENDATQAGLLGYALCVARRGR